MCPHGEIPANNPELSGFPREYQDRQEVAVPDGING